MKEIHQDAKPGLRPLKGALNMRNGCSKHRLDNIARNPAVILLITMVLLSVSCPVWAGSREDRSAKILPPNSKPYGKAYGEWSGAWVRWLFSIPAEISPILDLTGQDAAAGQSGIVWFLVPTFGGIAERSVTIPAGTYGPAVDDGYCLMLAPLAHGEHTIQFTAALPDGSFSEDVTYHIAIADSHE
jgi:hypothetical protein